MRAEYKGCGLDIRYSDAYSKPVKVALLEFEPALNQATIYLGLSDGVSPPTPSRIPKRKSVLRDRTQNSKF